MNERKNTDEAQTDDSLLKNHLKHFSVSNDFFFHENWKTPLDFNHCTWRQFLVAWPVQKSIQEARMNQQKHVSLLHGV